MLPNHCVMNSCVVSCLVQFTYLDHTVHSLLPLPFEWMNPFISSYAISNIGHPYLGLLPLHDRLGKRENADC